MMKTLSILSVAVLIATVTANCPNSCSGSGTCGADDKCTCYPNYQGLDCSERVCPFQIAFADVASADNSAHAYAECSGKGVCDRKSGTCKCFAGYEGEACRRTSCPNGCSGHGTCELMSEIAADASLAAGGASGRVFNTWESAKHQVCKCDTRWSGVDCSARSCPLGDDPLTVSGVAEVQDVYVSDVDVNTANSGTDMTGSYTVSFTDQFNGVWTTRPIKGYDNDAGPSRARASSDLELALNGLPNQVIKGATVTAAVDTSFNSQSTKMAVTFSQKYNPGKQNLMTINVAGCVTSGCQPRFVGIGGGATPAGQVVRLTPGTYEKAVCSNRGACDAATGLCACHSGYYGEACEMQTALF